MAGVAVNRYQSHHSPGARDDAFKKGDPDREPGDNKRAAIGVNDTRYPDYTPEVEAYLLRAFPENEVPGAATLAARNGWNAIHASAHSTGSWRVGRPTPPQYQ